MLIKRRDTARKHVEKKSFLDLYDLLRDDMGVVRGFIDGRFPMKGKNLNKECDLVYFVISGYAEVHQQDNDVQNIQAGDVLLLEKGISYWLQANELEVVEFAKPAWNPEQYRRID